MKRFGCFLLLLTALLLAGCGKSTDEAVSSADVNETAAAIGETYGDVADGLERSEYVALLEGYLDRLAEDAGDKAAQIGTIKCQIKLGEAELAENGIALLQQVSPDEPIIPELFVDMAEETGNLNYSLRALSIAREYGNKEFLAKVPEAPAFSQQGGAYDRKLTLELSAEEDAEIIVTVNNDYFSSSDPYSGPVSLVLGKNMITAYAIRGFYVSDEIGETYYCNYEPTPVTFTDIGMEEAVRDELGIPAGVPLTDVDCEKVQQLYHYNSYGTTNIYSLTDLDKFPNLQNLTLYNLNFAQDYDSIGVLKNLRRLTLSACDIKDISFLRELPSLQYLTISDNRFLSDLEPIYDCENLTELDCYTNAPEAKLDWSQFPQLTGIGVGGDEIDDWSVLLSMDNLESVYVSEGLPGVDTSVLGQLRNVTSLAFNGEWSIAHDRLSDLSFLQELTELRSLTLYNVVDPEQLLYVTTLGNLSYLTLNRSSDSITLDIMNTIQAALPQCTINVY